jgi:hypothetical protein
MRKLFVSAVVLPIAVLFGCGTPLVWRGPAGTGEQDLADTKRACLARSEAWRGLNMQAYNQSGAMYNEMNNQRAVPGELYRSADQLFQQCMREEGYTLVPRE